MVNGWFFSQIWWASGPNSDGHGSRPDGWLRPCRTDPGGCKMVGWKVNPHRIPSPKSWNAENHGGFLVTHCVKDNLISCYLSPFHWMVPLIFYHFSYKIYIPRVWESNRWYSTSHSWAAASALWSEFSTEYISSEATNCQSKWHPIK